MTNTRKKESLEIICTFEDPTPEEITEQKITQGVYIVERAYVMAQSIMKALIDIVEHASSADEVPDYWNSAADITFLVKKFELYDLSNVKEKLTKVIAMIDVVHLAHSCAYRVCIANQKKEIQEEYVVLAQEVLHLLNAYGRIGDSVMHKPNDTKTRH